MGTLKAILIDILRVIPSPESCGCQARKEAIIRWIQGVGNAGR